MVFVGLPDILSVPLVPTVMVKLFDITNAALALLTNKENSTTAKVHFATRLNLVKSISTFTVLKSNNKFQVRGY